MGETHVVFRDPKRGHRIGSAYIGGNQRIHYDIQTRHYQNMQSRTDVTGTDIFMDAFEMLGGKENIQGIHATWVAHQSLNYKQFMDAISKGFDSETAARMTWTGDRALQLDYDVVTMLRPEGAVRLNAEPRIDVLFTRSLK